MSDKNVKKAAPALGRNGFRGDALLGGNEQPPTTRNHSKLSKFGARRIDFKGINSAAIDSLGPVLSRLVPGGRIVSGEYVALNPRRGDTRLGSFKIRINGPRAGVWADFATGEKGGDVVSLVAYLEGVSQGEAARLLARILGLDSGVRRNGR